MMKRLRLSHKKDGTVEVDAEGFRGVGCKEFSRPFEEANGLDPSTRLDKAEAFDTESEKETNA